MTIARRIELLRERMTEHGLAAYVIPSSDPHQSEYPPDHWKSRQWISGFEGSAGTVVVTHEHAGLWTDSRYYLEAEEVLADTPLELFRAGQPEVPAYVDWLSKTLAAGSRVGYDAAVLSLDTARSLEAGLAHAGVEAVASQDLVGMIRQDRPPLPSEPAELIEDRVFGEARESRLARIREAMLRDGAGVHVIASLDDIAWALNLRGADVSYNPVVLAYLVIETEQAILFMDPAKLSDYHRSALTRLGVRVRDYERIDEYLRSLPAGSSVLYDPARVSVRLAAEIPHEVTVVEKQNPSTAFKARKNRTELEHLRSCMVTDGIAMTRFLHWLEATAPAGGLTELDVARRIGELRGEAPDFVGPSFETIAGYGEHGAVIHYRVTEQSNAALRPGSVLLLDSGGQYRSGTTDITRTVPIGEVEEQIRTDFTLVLKAHIALAATVFPAGTTGHQLDAVPRRPMWEAGTNYGHGTGHGVGFYLNVHEGPQRISPMPNSVALEPGMLISNEPGLYRAGGWGIRIENLVVVVEDRETDFGRFLRFETLTLCPIERSLIDTGLLTAEERRWIDAYHTRVRERLEGGLEEPVRSWLHEKTRPL